MIELQLALLCCLLKHSSLGCQVNSIYQGQALMINTMHCLPIDSIVLGIVVGVRCCICPSPNYLWPSIALANPSLSN